MNQNKKGVFYFLFFAAILLVGKSCVKEGETEPNPFEENKNALDTVQFVPSDIDPNSIAGLYHNIFAPTCANVGCHDGTFDPDFRTIESSYYSLVYRTPIKNDGSLTYRVDPGNPEQSSIIKRLSGEIEPPMPIEIEPDSDWLEKSDEYIQNVRTWIENGALDLSGNVPQFDYISPSIIGALAMVDGELLIRKDDFGTILIPDSINNIEFFLAFDPINNANTFSLNELKFSMDIDFIAPDTSIIMEVMDFPISEYGLYGELIKFTHRIELNMDSLLLSSGQYFMRIDVQEETNPATEIPTDDGLYYIKEYMSITLID